VRPPNKGRGRGCASAPGAAARPHLHCQPGEARGAPEGCGALLDLAHLVGVVPHVACGPVASAEPRHLRPPPLLHEQSLHRAHTFTRPPPLRPVPPSHPPPAAAASSRPTWAPHSSRQLCTSQAQVQRQVVAEGALIHFLQAHHVRLVAQQLADHQRPPVGGLQAAAGRWRGGRRGEGGVRRRAGLTGGSSSMTGAWREGAGVGRGDGAKGCRGSWDGSSAARGAGIFAHCTARVRAEAWAVRWRGAPARAVVEEHVASVVGAGVLRRVAGCGTPHGTRHAWPAAQYGSTHVPARPRCTACGVQGTAVVQLCSQSALHPQAPPLPGCRPASAPTWSARML
jgi:hypothetical protein